MIDIENMNEGDLIYWSVDATKDVRQLHSENRTAIEIFLKKITKVQLEKIFGILPSNMCYDSAILVYDTDINKLSFYLDKECKHLFLITTTK